MLSISRRSFLLGSASAIAVTRASGRVLRGSLASKVGQTVVNAGGNTLAFLNLAKGFTTPSGTAANFTTTVTSDGFPTGTLGGSLTFQGAVDPYYYGHYTLWWTGSGNLQFSPPTIVYNGGACAIGITPSNTGTTTGNFTVGGSASQPTQASPIEFAFGALIASVAASGSLTQFTTSSAVLGSNFPTGSQIKFGNLTYNGGAFPVGPNLDGSWSITVVSSTLFTLNGSDGSLSVPALNPALISVVGTGGPGVQTECIIAPQSNITNHWLASTFTGFGGIVWCKTAYIANAIAGQLAAPEYVTAFKSMNPRFIRFMDFSGVQGDRSSGVGPSGPAAYRTKTTSARWNSVAYWIQDYYTPSTSITNTGASGSPANNGPFGNFSDVYTCSSPTASPASGAYVEGEIIVGQLGSSAVSTGYMPALNVNGRGAKPVYATTGVTNGYFTGSVPASGQTVNMVFTGGGLNGPHTLSYTVGSRNSDTTLAILGASLISAIAADTTLQAVNISAGSSQPNPDALAMLAVYFNPNIANSSGTVVASLNAGLTISCSDTTSSAVYNFGTMHIGDMKNSNYVQCTYSTKLGGWIATVQGTSLGGIQGQPPLEFYADLCVRANVGCYINIGLCWSDARITNTVTTLANLGVKELLLEFSNETWNFSAQEANLCMQFGTSLGFPIFTQAQMCFYGLRTIQIATLAAAAWIAAGKSRSTLFINTCYQFVGLAASQPNKLNGGGLNAASGTNPALSAFGGYGSTAIPTNPSTGQPFDYSSFPNRPVDFSDAIGGAPYWAGGQYNSGNGTSSNIVTSGVPLSAYNGLLLQAYNYRYGNPTEQAAAINFCYSGGSSGTGDLYNCQLNGAYENFRFALAAFVDPTAGSSNNYWGVGTTVSSYDTARLSLPAGQVGQAKLGVVPYEGGWYMGPITLADSAQIAAAFNAAYSGSGYGSGFTSSLPGATTNAGALVPSTATDDANNMATLLAAFKQTQQCQDLWTRYLTECIAAGNSGGARLSLATSYGYSGQSATLGTYWSIYPSTSALATPTRAVNAIQALDG